MKRAARGMLFGALSFGAIGGAFAALAVARGHFPFLGAGERAELFASWIALAGLNGALLGALAGLLSAGLRRQGSRRTLCAAVLTGGLAAVVAAALLPGRSLWDQLGPAAAAQPVPAVRTRPDPPNLVLVSVDTLRADHLGAYGYPRPTSPRLDRLAAEGAVFEAAIAQAPETRRSMAALLTGLYPHVFDYERHLRGDSGPLVGDGFETVAERLRRGGYATAGFISNPVLVAANGYGQGFELWDEQALAGGDEVERRSNVADVVEPAIRWLDRARPPFFLAVHVMDPHHPYEPERPGPWEDLGEPWRAALLRRWGALSVSENSQRMKQLRDGAIAFEPAELDYLIDRYDSEILQVDAGIGRLLDALEQRGYDGRNTYLVVTADHGEEFMDHAGLLHGHTFFDELIRVPLLLRGPGIPRGLRVAQQVRLVDVAATLLAWAGLDAGDLDGASLAPYFSGGGDPRPALSFRGTRYVALRTPHWKLVAAMEPYPRPSPPSWGPAGLVWTARTALRRRKRDEIGAWHLAVDSAERANVLGARRRHASRLEGELRSLLAASPLRRVESSRAEGPSERTVEMLRALGYAE